MTDQWKARVYALGEAVPDTVTVGNAVLPFPADKVLYVSGFFSAEAALRHVQAHQRRWADFPHVVIFIDRVPPPLVFTDEKEARRVQRRTALAPGV